MTRIFRESDATLDPIQGKTIAILGYGNQGSAQALNLRDSGMQVIVGNAPDDYAAQAKQDGFAVYSIAEAADRGDIVLSLLPDEVTPQIYREAIRPGLRAGKTLSFASGYCVCYHQVEFPPDINVIMVAPRTMGAIVREDYVHGRGFLSFVDVQQDVDGRAWPTALALAKAIGSLRSYALQVSFKEETELDLFTEQALVPALVAAIKTSVEVLIEAGYPKVSSVLEMYLSGEMGDVLREAARRGLVGQTSLHSPTSQFGTKTRLPRFETPELKQKMQKVLAEVQDGTFARQWTQDQAAGYPEFKQADGALRSSAFAAAEAEVIRAIEPAREVASKP